MTAHSRTKSLNPSLIPALIYYYIGMANALAVRLSVVLPCLVFPRVQIRDERKGQQWS